MALPQPKFDTLASFAPALVEAGTHVAAPSPARLLHERLHQSIAAEQQVQRWSHRRRLAFILTSAAGLWATLIGSGYGLVHLIA